jgi:hypothetical protein
MTRALWCLLLLAGLSARSQDRLYFRDGTVKTGILVSVAREHVYFRASDTSQVTRLDKNELVVIEQQNGARYLFSKKSKKEEKPQTAPVPAGKRHSLSIAPLEIFAGRATFIFEQLTKDGRIGIAIPVSLTFDPFGPIYALPIDTVNFSRITGVNFITGADLNIYIGKKPNATFFLGPRLRYGTDVFLSNITGFSYQTQLGWRFGRPGSRFVSHLSVGYGFVRIFNSPAGPLIDSNQSYGWYSLNYRLGVRW